MNDFFITRQLQTNLIKKQEKKSAFLKPITDKLAEVKQGHLKKKTNSVLEERTWTWRDRSVAREMRRCPQLLYSCRRPAVPGRGRPWRPASTVFEPGSRWGRGRKRPAGTRPLYVPHCKIKTEEWVSVYVEDSSRINMSFTWWNKGCVIMTPFEYDNKRGNNTTAPVCFHSQTLAVHDSH